MLLDTIKISLVNFIIMFKSVNSLASCRADQLTLQCNKTLSNLESTTDYTTIIRLDFDICRGDMSAITNITSTLPRKHDVYTFQEPSAHKHKNIHQGRTSVPIGVDISLDVTFLPVGVDGLIFISLDIISKNISMYGFLAMKLYSGVIDDAECNAVLYWFKTEDNLTTLIVGCVFTILVALIGIRIMKRKHHPLPPLLEVDDDGGSEAGDKERSLTVIEEML